MAKVQKATVKIKKKSWVNVVAPAYMNETSIGDSYVIDPQTLIDRKVSANLMTLTNDIKKQNVTVRFTIDKVSGQKAFTSFDGYQIIPSAVRRLIRRGRNRIDYTLFLPTKEGINLKINVLLVTNGSTYKSALTQARHTLYLAMRKIVASLTVGEFVTQVITGRVQDEVKRKLKKVYPIRICEVRKIDIVREKHHALLKKEEVQETTEVEEELKEEVKEEAKEKREEVKVEEPAKEEGKAENKEKVKEAEEPAKEEAGEEKAAEEAEPVKEEAEEKVEEVKEEAPVKEEDGAEEAVEEAEAEPEKVEAEEKKEE